MRVSKSRNVCGYVKAALKHRKLKARLATKLIALEPLRRAAHEAGEDAKVRQFKLTGSQLAEADRILAGVPEPV